ncbi:2OG-Fe(II) oxygenase superfamily protein [Xylaria bambusicola]|uniref:2OG-Fe(II) oxygenase superfamily protein n=1 Tax=Xylaria bambusicola TaxID=326684 RepID=UPI002007E72D|nr:2OG-Fe(II) oxygenase superfamily protein [Xylaria bambusicola]KAI0512914.1 2OG-Fe(II) oxygenase superfamily protein [Xylaria bambusicola]
MGLLKSLSYTIFAAAITGAHSQPDQSASCQHPAYHNYMVSTSPLVIYLENFLTPQEQKHLQIITKDTFSRSGVSDQAGVQGQRETRTSQSTNVERDDIVRCIEERALLFQGFDTPRTHLEPLQLVKYGTGERYHFHTDWFTNAAQASSAVGGNRQSSFFAYVSAENITGGGTNFPMVKAPHHARWCDFIDCDEPWENGVTFRPIVGNAVFWSNLLDDGTGDQRTLHAGLPVTSGSKIGMNIWTRQGALSEDIRGKD